MSHSSTALFHTPKAQRQASYSEAESPSGGDLSESSAQFAVHKPAGWRSAISRVVQPVDQHQMILAELQGNMLKEERRINNDYHLKVHGSPSEWGKLVSKRILERHPLFSPSKGTWARPLRVDACIPDPPVDKRARREDTAMAVELDHVEELIRNEVLEALLGRQQLCSCGKLIEMGEMFSAHVLPCPHCRKQKCTECTALALEVRSKSTCCESCAMACGSCVRRLRLACSVCALGRRCPGAGCGGVRCSTCFNQLCEDCKELDHREHGDPAADCEDEHHQNDGDEEDDEEGDEENDDEDYEDNHGHGRGGDAHGHHHDDGELRGGTGFEYFYCKVCQFRSCQDCHRKNCYCAPATRKRAPDAIPSRSEGRSISHLFKKLGGNK